MKAALFLAFGFLAALNAQHAITPADVENGWRLYRGNCLTCHGPDGDFIPGVDFSHGKFIRAASDSDVAQVIIHGVPGAGMPSHNFSQQQAELVVAYIRSLAGTSKTGPVAVGDKIRGQVIFEGKGQCLTCHRINGKGSRVGPDLSEIGTFRRAGELQQALVEPDAEIAPNNRFFRVVPNNGAPFTGRLLNRDTFSMQFMDSSEHLISLQKSEIREYSLLHSSMPSYKDSLSSQELADVVSYLISLKGVDKQ
jgi:putative heme-binding domain-containing protein